MVRRRLFPFLLHSLFAYHHDLVLLPREHPVPQAREDDAHLLGERGRAGVSRKRASERAREREQEKNSLPTESLLRRRKNGLRCIFLRLLCFEREKGIGLFPRPSRGPIPRLVCHETNRDAFFALCCRLLRERKREACGERGGLGHPNGEINSSS